jgi:uncharacterized protein (DUF433 family)
MTLEVSVKATIIDRGRGPEIAGTRITVYDVLDYYQDGWPATRIAVHFRLSSDQVLAAIRYIETHRAEVMAEYAKMLERESRGNPPEIEARRKAVHTRMVERLKELRQSHPAEVTTDAGDRG